ncbi:unnamed protein product [Angiostrongylus costaricensis]|uniref:EB1 C-terminal domain-containing protein n=1 Tax=Angiostrongylus costaricensis TaxID=334426 RepID=A0A158PD50_ANGCS|nr:unnamed protein product [Angiostrongylus costaricensis]
MQQTTFQGDCAIRYYEVNQEYPFMHYINTYTTSEPQRAIGFQCKRGINSEENEINRIYKLTTKGVVDVLQFFVPRKSDLFQHDLYPDTRSTVPPLTAEEFMEGKNAVPNTQPVNPAAAQAKPKVQVVKKANILSQLAPTAADSSPARSYSEQTSPQVSAPPSPRPQHQQQQQQQPKRPVIDEDMGIVPMSQVQHRQQPTRQHQERQSPERERQSQTPKQQVNLRSRADRDVGGGAQTAGQRRAAAELERIRRDQARVPDEDCVPQRPNPSARMSVNCLDGPTNMEELLSDLAKMKAVMRQHERRIRILEEEIAEKNMSNAYSF